MNSSTLLLFGVVILTIFWSCSDLGNPEIKGCTDIDACNYNSDAMEDDGSCAVPTECDTCEDNVVVTNGALDGVCETCVDDAIVDNDADNDNVCDVDESSGCTDETACNYNASATEDDESCVFVDDVCETCVNGTIVDNDADDDGTCDTDEVVSYSTQIQPIFTTSCTGCHGGSGGLYLDSHTNLMAGGNSGAVVIPENGAGSLLIKKLRDEHAPSMPLGNCCIESSLIDLIETWIDEGAQDN